MQKFANFQQFQLDNLVDLKKCCKTHICLQRSVPIEPKTSNILPKSCQKLATARSGSAGPSSTTFPSSSSEQRGALLERGAGAPAAAEAPVLRLAEDLKARLGLGGEGAKLANLKFAKLQILQIFSGLVLGCISAKFCNKICV